ncbi:MAG: DUF2007 domain-containing protein [Pirellulales bacterium]
MNADDLVTVYSDKDVTRAEMVKNFLEAEGIRACVSGINQGSLSGIVDVLVQVAATDVARAQEVIDFHESSEDDLTEEDGLSDEPGDEGIELGDGQE